MTIRKLAAPTWLLLALILRLLGVSYRQHLGIAFATYPAMCKRYIVVALLAAVSTGSTAQTLTITGGVLSGCSASCTGNLVIPNTVTSISGGAFAFGSFVSVTIPNSVTSIGGSAFADGSLTSITLGSGLTAIGHSAFASNSLTSVSIPSGVTSIGDYAFQGNLFTSISIPNGVTSIGEGAFERNDLTSVIIPSNVTTIGNGAFSDNMLTSILFEGDRPAATSASAFSGNINLAAVNYRPARIGWPGTAINGVVPTPLALMLAVPVQVPASTPITLVFLAGLLGFAVRRQKPIKL